MTDDAPNQTQPTTPAEPGKDPLAQTKTTISRAWAGKWIAIIVVFIGLAIWGYVDATIVYPARGQKHIDHARRDYLRIYDANNRRFEAEGVSVVDPADERERLESAGGALSEVDVAKLEWIDALSRLHSLESIARENEAELASREAGAEAQTTKTLIVDPEQHLQELSARLGTSDKPKPLNPLDLPIQWGFVVVGLGGGIPIILMFVGRVRKTYRYDPATRTVTFPDGATVSPPTLTLWDKRDWHKFYIWIRIEGESDERKVDLYPYVPLEAWLVDVYEHSPIYEPEDDQDDAEDERPGEDAPDGSRESQQPDES